MDTQITLTDPAREEGPPRGQFYGRSSLLAALALAIEGGTTGETWDQVAALIGTDDGEIRAYAIEHGIREPGITDPQRATFAEMLGNVAGRPLSAALKLATADEMAEPAKHGFEAVAHNAGSIAYPVAAVLIETADEYGTHDVVSLLDADGQTLETFERN